MTRMDKRGQLPAHFDPELVKEDSPRIIKAKKKAREISIKEGAAANVAGGTGGSYITPFALAINANAFHIGLLSSFSGLVSPIAQFFGSRLMEKHSRKKLVIKFVMLQSLVWLPISLLSYLYWRGLFQSSGIFILIALYLAIVIFGGLSNPSWFSWMGDIIPPNERGRFFGKRNRATASVGLATALIAAFILDAFQTKGLALLGFSLLFLVAFTFRFISHMLFRKQFSPKFKVRKKDYFPFWSFVKRFDNFGKFSVYRAFLRFSMMIAGPFFAVYMLENLQFNYVTFMLVSLSATVFYLIFIPFAGKFSDRYGNIKLVYISGILFALIPLFWIFLKKPLHLIFIPQLVAGIANAAWAIGITNFTYDSVSPRHRGIIAAYTSMLIGIGVFFGSLIGGLLVNNMPVIIFNSFATVFIISSVLRFGTLAYFLPKLKEETKKKKLPPMAKINLSHPLKTVDEEIEWFRSVFR